MSNQRIIDVECKCNFKLFHYIKVGKGRLIKCYLKGILVDNVGVVNAEVGFSPNCPECKRNLGPVTIVRGKYALKLNQGTVKPVRI